MRTLTLLGAVLVALPVVAAESDFKAMFAKHWQIAKEFTLLWPKPCPPKATTSSPTRKS